MKLFITLFVCCMAFAVPSFGDEKKVEGHVIPKESKSEYDFRGKLSPLYALSPAAKKLPDCKTYEELRDTLKEAIPEFIQANW